jgi:hypothetical protein
VLEQFAQAMRCEWGAYWALDPSLKRLQVLASWSGLGEQGQLFEQDTRVRTLAPQEGNAGHVWRSRRPILATNLTLDMCWPRCLRASEAGLRAGLWFAVQTDRVIYGVIELLARALPYTSTDALVTLERVGLQLGFALEELHSDASRLH